MMLKRLLLLVFIGDVAVQLAALAQQPFMAPEQWAVLRDEASGAAPYENLRALTRLHRVPGTEEFDQAAAYMLARARDYGLQEAQSEQFPIDGKIHYGLMRSHLGWKVSAGSLWQVQPTHQLLGDWASDPIHLADYSHSADVEAPLIDVGSGMKPSDYQGKEVRGKIVLASGVLSVVQQMAVTERGAVGIVSDMPNQRTAWSGQDNNLVRWGHLDATLPQGFAFMLSHRAAEGLRRQLNGGPPVILKAQVKAEVGPGHWTVLSAIIAGSDPHAGEIVYSCHLDHERPGANDNGSGCVTILESARLLTQLIASGRLPRPTRTLRFIWGPEIEGTMAYLNGHPAIRKSMLADIHMDMVGGDPFRNKAILHVTETPWSLPSFVTDIGGLFAETIEEAAARYSEDGSGAAAAVVEDRDGANGSRNRFFVDRTPYAEGSDHDVYDSSTIAVPSLYLRDWPDIYIHTDHDSLDEIDATKLRRVALLGAASGYVLASLDASHAVAALNFFSARAQARLAKTYERAQILQMSQTASNRALWLEARNLVTQSLAREQGELRAFAAFIHNRPPELAAQEHALAQTAALMSGWIDQAAKTAGVDLADTQPEWRHDPAAMLVPQRIGAFGPLTYQNDDVLKDRLGADRLQQITLFKSDANRFVNVQQQGALYAYEIVNFVDGKRNAGDIRDAVSAEIGPIDLALVVDYLKACEAAEIIKFQPH